MDIVERFLALPSDSFFLFGPRGTGKSTWLRQQLPDALWLDLLDPARQREYQARPERLRELVMGNEEGRPVVIDEVQKAPALLDIVHSLIESSRTVFALTGSSARKRHDRQVRRRPDHGVLRCSSG